MATECEKCGAFLTDAEKDQHEKALAKYIADSPLGQSFVDQFYSGCRSMRLPLLVRRLCGYCISIATVGNRACETCKGPMSLDEEKRSKKNYQEWAAKTPDYWYIADQYHRGEPQFQVPVYARMLCDPCRLYLYEIERIGKENWDNRPSMHKVIDALNGRGCAALPFIIILILAVFLTVRTH